MSKGCGFTIYIHIYIGCRYQKIVLYIFNIIINLNNNIII